MILEIKIHYFNTNWQYLTTKLHKHVCVFIYDAFYLFLKCH